MKKYAFGVDIGGTTVKMGFFRTNGTLVDTWEIPTRTEENGKYILTDITVAVEQKLKEKNISKLDVEGIGMGVPGPVGLDGTVFKCVNLGWGIFNVENELSQITGLKVKAGNDANVAALGEMWQGSGKGYKDMVMVTLGTGVGEVLLFRNIFLPESMEQRVRLAIFPCGMMRRKPVDAERRDVWNSMPQRGELYG